jgi:GXWXG protein/Domain of unknown function (DUF4334)
VDDAAAAREWVRRAPEGLSTDAALRYFDRQQPVAPDVLPGRWRGVELPTGHPLDGLLAVHGWYGKEFLDAERVHPLLFTDRAGVPHPVDPTPAPLGLIRRHPRLLGTLPARAGSPLARRLLRTRRPAGRVRTLCHRDVLTSALVYDRLPVIDVLRRVDDDVLIGLMDLRGVPQPYFFLLLRD